MGDKTHYFELSARLRKCALVCRFLPFGSFGVLLIWFGKAPVTRERIRESSRRDAVLAIQQAHAPQLSIARPILCLH
jgi:hypothetical protein